MKIRPIILCILDGWGYRLEAEHNAIALANTPTWDHLIAEFPYTLLQASAHFVGLPLGQMGNSEVGHMNIGAGRIILQDLPRIDHAISCGEFMTIAAYTDFKNQLKTSKGACHLVGLLSPGGVHSHQNHILAFAKDLSNNQIPVYIHAFLDGRDTPPTSGFDYLQIFLKDIHEFPLIQIASIGGRYYGMDRDQRWDRIEKSYRSIMYAQADHFQNPLTYIQENYKKNINDEFIIPAINLDYHGVQEQDGLIHMNFRSDRTRQLLSALVLPDFNSFNRGNFKNFTVTAGLVEYSTDLNSYCPAFFPTFEITESLGEIISRHGLKQLRAAETEKYAHVTFFFNAGREKPFEGEDRLLVASPLVATYDLQPEMSAFDLTSKLCETFQQKDYDLIVVNYANADMVGHSGNLSAAIKAVECLDQCLKQLCHLVDQNNGILIVTADHGNVEQIYDQESQQPHTAHTLNPVPFVLYGTQLPRLKNDIGQLSDVAPTILALMKIEKPKTMTGKNLIF